MAQDPQQLSQAMTSSSNSATSTTNNLASDLKPPGDSSATKVKPCCVCKDEKAARDECMLFSNSDDPQKDCEGLVGRYRTCMAGFGFATG
ncbi:MAG: hypothetical protein M1828_006175 [Chrysothrix sp. TS-e1954]|nr:MAG: hypothetical protein M1828_006175 [Chrysothrix sp. TS-e1954]